MTVVCTDGVSVAADTLMTFGNERQPGHQKLRASKTKTGTPAILAYGGTAALADALEAWWQLGAQPEAAPRLPSDDTWQLLVVMQSGLTFYSNRVPYPLAVAPPFCMGTGGDYALGAMKAGASPRRACEIACEIDINSGGPVQVLDLQEAESPGTKIVGINPKTGRQIIRQQPRSA